jgi:hypothetical protein
MKKSALFIACLSLLLAGFTATIVDTVLQSGQPPSRIRNAADLVGRLGLTDLALFTEARYTRHPTQSDIHSAFQDHPGALEHFPTGSLLPPPMGSAP